jgi:hypothetical protein
MSTVRWHPRGESERRRLRGSGYKFGVTGGWKSMQEIYELIRREMIEKAYARNSHTQCIMLQERGAPWSAKAGANDSVERCLWRVGGECARDWGLTI